jgi:hypothetical protein
MKRSPALRGRSRARNNWADARRLGAALSRGRFGHRSHAWKIPGVRGQSPEGTSELTTGRQPRYLL